MKKEVMNTRREFKNNTGLRGITWRKTRGKFQANIYISKTKSNIHIGNFATLQKASDARKQFIMNLL